MAEKMVRPVFEREPESAPGPFYAVKNLCTIGSLPIETVRENIKYQERLCATCADPPTKHCCFITRQPETPDEVRRMIELVGSSSVAAFRYCGTDAEILRRLVEAGCKEQCDALCQNKSWRHMLSSMAGAGGAVLAWCYWSFDGGWQRQQHLGEAIFWGLSSAVGLLVAVRAIRADRDMGWVTMLALMLVLFHVLSLLLLFMFLGWWKAGGPPGV